MASLCVHVSPSVTLVYCGYKRPNGQSRFFLTLPRTIL